MFCCYCGAKLNDEAKFCSACGKPVAAPAEDAKAHPVQEPEQQVEPTENTNLIKQKPVATKKIMASAGAAAFWDKKVLGKLPLKFLLAGVAAVVVIVLAIVLISNAVEEKKRTTILGTIPDPETFVGASADHDYYDAIRYEHWITFQPEDVTKEMVLAYVDLLRSNQYPFLQTDEISFNDGMVRYVFRYNGEKELYEAYSRQIMVEYKPYTKTYALRVEIMNSKNFELVPVGKYGTAEAGQSIPEPEETPTAESEKPSNSGDNTAANEGKPSKNETPAQPAKPQTVAGPISVNNAIEAPANAVPELIAWSGGAATAKELAKTGTVKMKYTTSGSVIEDYVKALQANGFTLIDEYYFSYRDTFQSWAFTCDAVPNASTIAMQYEDTPCHVCVWRAADDDEFWVDISPSLQFFDTGLRRGGGKVNQVISGPSAGAGLLRLSDGSYQTSDGRLTAAAGNAMVIRDGKTYTCDTRWEVEGEDERLWVENYYRNEGFFFEVPKNSLMEGDVLQIPDLIRERYYVTEKDKLDHYNYHTPFFALAHDGMWKGPQLNDSTYEALTVRVMYYQEGGEAVYYVYAKLKNAQPAEVEALCVVNMATSNGGNFSGATRMKVGDTVELEYTGEVFGAHYDVYDWEITDGSGNVYIDSVGDRCEVTARSKGVATVTVTYKYGVTEPDVLTGNPTTAAKSKTQSYNFIIE